MKSVVKFQKRLPYLCIESRGSDNTESLRRHALSRARCFRGEECHRRVVGKSGVGKSTVAANLAVALSKLGYSVCWMPIIFGPSIPKMFQVEERVRMPSH